MKNRGMGFCFQPTYVSKKTGEKKTAATWWISYSDHGSASRRTRTPRARPLRASS